jgi:RecB family exonuclease
MARRPEPDGGDSALAALADAVTHAQRDDPLAPVTIVTPSPYATLFVRRMLGARMTDGTRRGIANVTTVTADELLRVLGTPGLEARSLRPAPRVVDLEAIRVEAQASGDWLASMADHPRALRTLARACGELRRCPEEVVEMLARRSERTAGVAALLLRVRDRLHDRGFGDSLDLATSALEAARARGEPAASGVVIDFGSGPLPPLHREVADLVKTVTVDLGWSCGPDPLTEVRGCTDPAEEARAAVRAVLTAADEGVPLWSQAIFHPAGPTYARAIHQELAAAGVAANGPALRHLDRSAAGTMVLGLLELGPGDWARDQVVAWLSTAPIRDGRGGRPVPVSRWDLLSSSAGVVRGIGQWRGRLEHLASREPGTADEAGALTSFVDRLVARITAAGGSWAEHAAWAVSVMDDYLDIGDHWPPDQRAAAEQVRDAVSALRDLDAVSGRAGGPDGPTFRRMVRTVLEETELDVKDLLGGGFGDGVFVAPYPYARGVRFDAVVVVGLADGVVPGRVGEDALLPEEIRRLDPSGGLRPRQARLDEIRDDVWAAVGAGRSRRIATHPRTDPRTGRAHVPTRWLEALESSSTIARPVASFAAGVAEADPPLSVCELELHSLEHWAAGGRDPVAAPAALASPRLAVGIGAMRGRAGSEFTRFDGYVGPGLVSPFDPDAPVSATRLETYAKCPRRFLFERILGIERRVYPEELWRMEATDRGTLVHLILEDYLSERVDGADRSLARLREIAERRLDEAEAGGLVGKPLLWRMDRAAILRNLDRFHDEEGDLVPLAAEFAFGTGEEGAGPPVPVTLPDGRTVSFKGKADRVDRSRAGQLVVSDYKTGRQGGLRSLSKDPLAGGTLLQLPIYALAADARFGTGGTVHARYWLLSDQRSAPCYHLVVTQDVEARFRTLVALIAGAVDAGAFPGAPVGPSGDRQFEQCRWCDFDTVCPSTRDRQWARKERAAEVAPAVELLRAAVPEDLAGTVVRRFVDPDEVGA